MLKKVFIGALIALSTLGFVTISEAHHGDNYDCRDNYNQKNLCCGNYGRGNYDGCCYDGAYCCR